MTNAVHMLLTKLSALNFNRINIFLQRIQIMIKLAMVSSVFRFDDLVVGCPYFYEKEKDNIRLGGAVYVYIGNGDMVSCASLL